MPKTYNKLFDKICSLENLYKAYKDAKKNKRFKPEILAAGFHIEEIIHTLREELLNCTWKPQGYREFLLKSEVKRRIIHAPTFRDRIVHHAIIRVVKELFERKFIFDSYAVTVHKGQIKAVKRLQKFLRRSSNLGEVYVLQCDISKYYPSMDHEILLEEIKRTIRDKKVLKIWKRLIESFGDTKGLPIGAYTSQLSANIYLNVLDHFVKEKLQWKFYLRYMDDFILIGNNKQELRIALKNISEFLNQRLKLTLNSRTKIFKVNQGVNFAGYRTFVNKILPRKRNVKAARKRFKKFVAQNRISEISNRVYSFLGYMKHCDGYCTAYSVLKNCLKTLSEKYLSAI